MSLPHTLLGLLNYHPATGYEIKAAFEQSVHFFWNATLPQIYRTLNNMEEQGWLAVTVEHQDGKPSRKVYRVTDSGGEEFRRWLAEPPEVIQPRSPMLIKVFFGKQMDPDDLKRLLAQWRDHHCQLLKKYEEVLPVIQHYQGLTGAGEDARYWAMTLDFGRRHAQMVVEWCGSTIDSLKREEKSIK